MFKSLCKWICLCAVILLASLFLSLVIKAWNSPDENYAFIKTTGLINVESASVYDTSACNGQRMKNLSITVKEGFAKETVEISPVTMISKDAGPAGYIVTFPGDDMKLLVIECEQGGYAIKVTERGEAGLFFKAQ